MRKYSCRNQWHNKTLRNMLTLQSIIKHSFAGLCACLYACMHAHIHMIMCTHTHSHVHGPEWDSEKMLIWSKVLFEKLNFKDQF